MRKLVVALVLVGVAAQAPAQEVSLGIDALAGATSGYLSSPFGALQLHAEMDWGPAAVSAAYRRVSIARQCKTSQPPQCDVDTPGGQVLVVGGSVILLQNANLIVRGGLHAGAGRFLTNARDSHETQPVLGGMVRLDIPLGRAGLRIGSVMDWSTDVWFGGGSVGLAWRM